MSKLKEICDRVLQVENPEGDVIAFQVARDDFNSLVEQIDFARIALRCIENTPPENLIAVEGKNEHWWYRLVADMKKQATEALSRDVQEQETK